MRTVPLLVAFALVFALVLGSAPVIRSSDVEKMTTGFPEGWTSDIRITDHPNSDVNPSIAYFDSNIYIVWERRLANNYETFYINSTNAGEDWNNPVQLSSGTAGIYCRNQDIGIDNSNIHVIWDDNDAIGREIRYIHSTDGGITWSSPKMISVDDGFYSEGAKIAVNGSSIHVVWVDDRFGFSQSEVYYKRSTDGGITWDDALGNPDTDRRITHDLSGAFPYGIGINGSNIHVLFGDDRDGSFDVYYIRSTDNGVTWDDGSGTVDEERKLTTNATDHIAAALAVNGSTIHVVWVDEVWPGPVFSIYYRNSTDNGATWGAIQQLVSPFAGTAYAPQLAVQNDTVHMTWHDMRDGDQPEIYYKNSTDNGATWSPDLRLTVLDGFISGGPKIAVSGSQKHIIWEDQRDGNSEIYYKRYPDFPVPVVPPTFSMELRPGWNLIGIPTDEPDWNVSALLASIHGEYDTVQSYDSNLHVWRMYDANAPAWANTLNALSPQDGLWVHVTASESIEWLLGGPEHSLPVSTMLRKGWNLVGYPSLNGSVTLSESLAGVPWDAVQYCDQARPYNLRYMPADATMEPGRGYWVHVTSDCVWTVG